VPVNFKNFSSGINPGFYTSDPSPAQNGDVYYNTVSNRFRGYQNGSWQDLINNGGSSSFASYASSVVNTSASVSYTGGWETFSNSPAFTFTPTLSGNYKVYASLPLLPTGNNALSLARIFNTSGGATLLQESQVIADGFESGVTDPAFNCFAQSIYTLVAGTTYVFDIQGNPQTGSAGLQLVGSYAPFYMFAEGVGLASLSPNVQISNSTGSGTGISTSESPIVDTSSNPLTVTVETNGGDVLVGLQDDGSGGSGYLYVENTPNTNSWPTIKIFFYRDGTLISTQQGMSGANATFNTSNWPGSAFHFIDANPPAGSHTYTVQAQAYDQDGGTPSSAAYYITLFAKNIGSGGGGGGASFELETPYSPATPVNTILPPLGNPVYFASQDQSSLSANSDAYYAGSGSVTNASATGNSGNTVIQSGSVAGSGNSGNIQLVPGAVNTGTQGLIQLIDGSQGTAGYVWTSIDTSGSGHWSSLPVSANVHLSNLVSPTAINQDLLPASPASNSLGSISDPWLYVWANDFLVSNIANNNFVGALKNDGSDNTQLISSSALYMGATGLVSIFTALATGSTPSASLSAATGAVVDGTSGQLSILTGAASGIGSSGGILLQPGTVVSGTRGKIQFKDGSEGNPYYSWISTDSNGDGAWSGLTTYPAASAQTLAAGFTIAFAGTNTYLPVTSAGPVSSDPTTIIAAGTVAGQTIIVENQGSYTITLLAGGNAKIPQGINFALNQYGIISLIWNGTVWNTLSTSANG